MNNQNIILSIKDLEKTYKTSSEELAILKKLNMELKQGQTCVIVGKSGSGKGAEKTQKRRKRNRTGRENL